MELGIFCPISGLNLVVIYYWGNLLIKMLEFRQYGNNEKRLQLTTCTYTWNVSSQSNPKKSSHKRNIMYTQTQNQKKKNRNKQTSVKKVYYNTTYQIAHICKVYKILYRVSTSYLHNQKLDTH